MFGRHRLRQLQHENALLREALAYYADVRHWQRRGANAKGEPRRWIKARLAVDRGEKARRALASVGEHPPAPSFGRRLRGLFRPSPKIVRRPTLPAPRDVSLSVLAE